MTGAKGFAYRRVLERAARDMERVGAGRIVGGSVGATGTIPWCLR